LCRIHGSCRDRITQIALDFTIVLDQEAEGDAREFLKRFAVPLPDAPKRLAEILALSGGPGGGDWKWTASGVNLGTAIVEPQRPHKVRVSPPSTSKMAPWQ
jgi:hypothetical protein